MHIALSADRRRISQATRHALDGFTNIRLRCHCGVEGFELGESHGSKHSASPSAKILRGNLAARHVAEPLVDIRRPNGATVPVLVNELEEMLPGNVLAGFDNSRCAAVGQSQPPSLPALALELKAERAAVNGNMSVAERG
jgi:hypothetical protein